MKSPESLRTWTGLIAVLASDAAIAVAAIWALDQLRPTQAMAVVTGAFTAITAITTAYFGIKATANTAQKALREPPERGSGNL
jgi:hypothetical protein